MDNEDDKAVMFLRYSFFSALSPHVLLIGPKRKERCVALSLPRRTTVKLRLIELSVNYCELLPNVGGRTGRNPSTNDDGETI